MCLFALRASRLRFSSPWLRGGPRPACLSLRGPPPRCVAPRSRRSGGAPPPPSLWLAPFATLRASLRFGRAVAYGGLLSAIPASAFAFRPARSLRSLLRSAARLRPFFFGWRGARFGWSSVSPRPDATLCAPYTRATSAGAPRCDHPRGNKLLLLMARLLCTAALRLAPPASRWQPLPSAFPTLVGSLGRGFAVPTVPLVCFGASPLRNPSSLPFLTPYPFGAPPQTPLMRAVYQVRSGVAPPNPCLRGLRPL